jgi:hypothetical protein
MSPRIDLNAGILFMVVQKLWEVDVAVFVGANMMVIPRRDNIGGRQRLETRFLVVDLDTELPQLIGLPDQGILYDIEIHHLLSSLIMANALPSHLDLLVIHLALGKYETGHKEHRYRMQTHNAAVDRIQCPIHLGLSWIVTERLELDSVQSKCARLRC